MEEHGTKQVSKTLGDLDYVDNLTVFNEDVGKMNGSFSFESSGSKNGLASQC